MQNIDPILNQIIQRFEPLEIEKLILFGSHAYGTPGENSDIDLLVVTSDDTLPQSFAEKSQVVLKVNRLIRDIKKRVPIDLIVHTRAMHRRFIELNSQFCREIAAKGKVLYESSR